jgi:Zn-dependent peptidase ImmA (M78 family)
MPERYTQQKFDWSGPTAEPLRSTLGLQPKQLFASKANEIRIAKEINGPPFDPYAYAKALGVVVEEVEELPMDGLLKRADSGTFVVQLKKEASHFRKNFTLAHELAHTFYYDHLMEHSVRFRGNRTADPEEEFLCNLGASELLMPGELFQRDLIKYRHDGVITPATLIQLSSLYQVSLQAVMIRCTGLMKNIICAIWRRAGVAINLEWLSPKKVGRLVLCQTTRSSIELAFENPGEIMTAVDSLYSRRNGNRMIRKKGLSLQLRTGSVISVLGPQNDAWTPARTCSRTNTWEQWWHR